MHNIFINSVGRLRSGWRSVIFFSLCFVFTILSAQIVGFALSLTAEPLTFLTGSPRFVVQSLVLMFAALLAGWICARGIEGLPFRSLGLNFHRRWWLNFLLGSLIGATTLTLSAFIASVFGRLTFDLNLSANFASISKTLLISLIIFILGALAEETIFRGYGLQTFVRARLAWVGIATTSVLFAFVHADNPNLAPLSLFNTLIAGIWFAIAYSKTRSLWFPLGLHWAWNWMMSAVLGLPVSGITEITPEPLLRGIDSGPEWITGGQYGIEGGAACTIVLIVSTLFFWLMPYLKPTLTMLDLTDGENPKREMTDQNQVSI